MAVVFWHPRPAYDPHILVVPTVPFRNLTDPHPMLERKQELIWHMLVLARETAATIDAVADWQVVINGGARQDIRHVHGHLIHAADGDGPGDTQLVDPANNIDGWRDLFDEIHRATRAPEPAFSVVVTIPPDGNLRARVTY